MSRPLGKRSYQSDVGRLATPLARGRTYLEKPLTHSSFDGDSFSDVTTSTEIAPDSWSLSIPDDARAILLYASAWDSAGFPTGALYFAVGPSPEHWNAMVCRPLGGDYPDAHLGWVPCVNGALWYRVNASGANTLDVRLYVWGYER